MRFVQAGVMLLGAVTYIVVPIVVLRLESPDAVWLLPAAFVGWNLLLVVATVIVLIDSVRKIRSKDTRALAADVFVVKLAAIPFFLINFTLLVLMNLLGAAFWFKGGIVLLTFAPLEIALTFLAMLLTSVYGWASIVQLRRDRVIGTGLTVLYSFLLFVFVTDIVAGILLFGHSRRRPGIALVVVLLVFGVVLAVPGFLIEGLWWFGVAGVVVVLATIGVGAIRLSRRRRVEELDPAVDEVAVEAVEATVLDKP